jgi:uncharacterized protein (TIGR03435 family)
MHRLVKTAAVICLICTFGGAFEVLEAQQSKPAFEVVSIRTNLEGGLTMGGGGTGGDTFRMTAATARRLISFAYHEEIMYDEQIVGAPRWLQTDRFDITAKPAGRTLNETRLMVRSLLAERFGLTMARQQRQGDVHLLKVARGDGRLGPDLRRVNDDCVNNRPKDAIAAGKTMPRPSSGSRPSYATQCATLDTVASYLSYELRTPVINGTGISGRWDVVLAHSGMQPRLGPDGLSLDDRPMLLSAVEEQLGLKLERQRGLVDVWVITSVHPPTEN